MRRVLLLVAFVLLSAPLWAQPSLILSFGPSAPKVTNRVRNSIMLGAVPGTPGTAPSNWSINSAGGLIPQIATGTETGVPYIDISFNGTPSSSGNIVVVFEGNTAIAASIGQTWSFSLYVRLVTGAWTNVSGFNIDLTQNTSAPAYVTETAASFSAPSGNPLASQRPSATIALTSGATTAFVVPSIFFHVTSGQAVSFTLRIGAPQMELGSTHTWIPTSGAIASTTDVPIGYR